MKGILIKIGAVLIALIVVGLIILSVANFSSGYRAGVPIKVSYKGFIFKTWEGELNVGGLNNSVQGAIPTTWAFSIADDNEAAREKIEEAITRGKRVKLAYKEKFVKFIWKGDTKYFATEVEILE
jgi:hypothetical protein